MTTVVLNTVTRKVEVFSSARDVQARAEIADHKAAVDPHPQYLAEANVADVALSGDAGDLIAGTVPDARMPTWTGYNVASRAALESAVVPAAVVGLRLLGYAAVGDGGGAIYKRAASEPAHAGKVQSADGNWWEIAEDVINIRQFGAVADDSTDNKTAIQNALDAGWETVLVPRGTYQTTTLTIPGNLTLAGEGMDVSAIKLLDGSEGVPVMEQLSPTQHIHIRHLRIDGNRANTGPGVSGGRGIHFVGVLNSSLTFCHITNARHNGVSWEGVGGSFIAFNKINNHGTNGLRFEGGTTTSHVRVIGNHCHDNGGLVHIDNGGVGIAVGDSLRFVIVGNICNSNYNNGIDLWNVHDSIISGNICMESVHRSGIAPDGGNPAEGDADRDLLITNNICRGNAAAGIVIANDCHDLLIANNNLRGNGTFAFRDLSSGSSTNIRAYNNLGHLTENNGVFQVGASETEAVVPHGLDVTPDRQDIQITPRTNWHNVSKWWVSASDSTTFTLTVDQVPGVGGVFFGWSHRRTV